VPKPIITAISTTVNYTINPTTFIEGTYGLTQNELAGCTNLQIMCNGTQGQGPAVPMGPNSNKFTAGLGELPVLFPGGLDMDSDYYEYKILQDMGAPFFVNGRIEMPPQISWNGRVANQPPSINYPGWLNINRAQDVAISLTKVAGRHTWKMGYYQNHSFKAQHRGQAGPGTLNFQNDAVGVNPLDTSFPFANAATGTFSSMTQLSRFVEGGWVYDNNEFFIQDNWKVNNRLTLDYGMRFVHQDPQYDNHFQSANFRPETFDPAQMPRLYEWTCITTFPCSGANRRAWDPVTGEILAANISSLAVGTIIPGTGNDLNGVNRVGEGITKKGYFWPALAFAPRFGMAYDLSGTQSFILRGGAGLFYDRPEGNTVYPLISNPPYARQVTVNYGDLRALGSGGLTFRGAPSLGSYEYHSDLPSSVQWNAGVQFSLPWASAFDAEYVGQHSYNTLIPNQGSQINQLDLGTLYLPSSQDPTQAVTTLGSNVRPVNALRAFRGWQNISHHISRNWRTYHSIQMSLNRRFRDGISASVNYTLSLYDHQSVTARWEHVPGTTEFRERADQEKAEELFGTGKIPHNLRANFVWDLPDWSPSSAALRGVAAVINDWQLAGIYTFRSGDTYSIGYSYQNGMGNSQLTGSPDYAARVRLVGDPGSGCSDNQLVQFNTAAAVGPDPFSDGLESSNSYLRQCPNNVWDLNVQRHIRLGGGRTISLQVQMFNAFNNVMFSNRQANMTLNNHIDKVIQNSPFDADGNPIATRILPNGSAGFGVVTGARALRTMQARIGFTF
jgi:hypothetical protein